MEPLRLALVVLGLVSAGAAVLVALVTLGAVAVDVLLRLRGRDPDPGVVVGCAGLAVVWALAATICFAAARY